MYKLTRTTAFRDRNAGSYNNRNRPTDEVKEAGRRGYRGRDDRGARTRTDRHPVRNTHTYVLSSYFRSIPVCT